MRRRMLILSFVLAAGVHQSAYAQFLDDPDTGGGLRLALEPIGSAGPLPTRFAIVLTNISRSDLRLPQPQLECGDVASGSVFLHARFLPSASHVRALSSACFIDKVHIPILDHVSHWRTLSAGQSLRLEIDLKKAAPDAPAPGTYSVWADYTPPAVSPDEMKLLQKNGVAVPTSPLATTAVEYHVPAN